MTPSAIPPQPRSPQPRSPQLGSPQLWIPGPTQVREELLAVCAEPMIGHRTSAMRDVIRGLDAPLRAAFGVRDEGHRVAMHSCTATGLMEMGLRALGDGRPSNGDGSSAARRPPRVLALVNGAFSERFAEVAESVGADVVRVRSAPGEVVDLEGAARRLRAEGPFDAITVCLSETSTGALAAPAEVAAAFADRGDAFLFIDAVTYLGAGPVDAAAHGFDFVFAGTQKALALPPGLGLFSVSDRLVEFARHQPRRGYFLDLVRIVESHAEASPPMTPTITLVRALLAQLRAIEGLALEHRLTDEPEAELRGLDGWALRYRRHARQRARVRAWMGERGLRALGDPSAERVTSPTVTCIDLPHHDVDGLLGAVRDAGFIVAPGYGANRGSSLRIGHMGDHSVAALDDLLACLGVELPRFSRPPSAEALGVGATGP